MDQNAFRKLLSSSSSSRSSTGTPAARISSLLPPRTKDKKHIGSSNDDAAKKGSTGGGDFKPRKVKKGADADAYRDRAAERRKGVAGDFAQVEAVLSDFEKQNADEADKQAVEERRRYLGGDAEHSVLVKGLDFALLEQTRAAVNATKDLEGEAKLESALLDSAIPEENIGKGKKRTREDIVRELKESREKKKVKGNEEESKRLEDAKSSGKFKPIASGFKPIGAEKEGTQKKTKKKKKADVDVGNEKVARKEQPQLLPDTQAGPSKPSASKQEIAASDPMDDDVDIFADAGTYAGMDFDDEDEEGGHRSKAAKDEVMDPAMPQRKWFNDDEEDAQAILRHTPAQVESQTSQAPNDKDNHNSTRGRHSENQHSDGEENDIPLPVKLVPLASSALPSVRDILAADDALEAESKRRARKEKRRAAGGGFGGGGGDSDDEGGKRKKKKVSDDETKLNREYQQIKAYTDKKGRG